MKKILLTQVLCLILLFSCNDKGTTSKTSDIKDTAGTPNSETLNVRNLYTVEITKDEFENIIRTLPEKDGKKKGKLIFQFSSSDLINNNILFDLAIYAAPSHKHYGQNVTPFIAKAVSEYLPIKNDTLYIFGNNEKSLEDLQKITQGLTWNKLRFYPVVDAKKQIRYRIFPFYNERNLFTGNKSGADSIAAINKLNYLVESEFYTNPSPPAKPYETDEDNIQGE